MADKINLEIITPVKVVLNTEVDEVAAPGALGEFGVLPGHVPFITTLNPGLVKYTEGTDEKSLFISGGLFNVDGDNAKIITESAELPSDIDSSEANQQVEDIQKLIDGFEGSKKELAELNKKLKIAEAKVEAS
ncbi:MAG: ATP synthase F1 subunit epsilon [Candidatus Dadabacteria bacterium]|nr:ATP synthase F1 subunit epsilon [Candidatus Dadabacteria bacterium]NIS07988.1 ATP synthase F1 subunit epsilon [Candidatus Dadabacteria bacterium]NIY20935.1 ATP synthase F1 subunit epsilon [Candidatus Dadabacteria bacterium]